jgi:4-aminobutyrate aminotransferase
MMDRLRAIESRHPSIGDVRGKGLMLAAELVKDKGSRARAPQLRDQLLRECYRRGLLLLGCGKNAIRFTPALVVDREDIDQALSIFETALTACEEGIG